MSTTEYEYEMCAHCRHFVEPNDVGSTLPFPVAEYVHLDNGEKEHDHDAAPGGIRGTLGAWREDDPGLFVTYPDGETGPNSAHYERQS
jgi:hypothetical protein